MRAAIALFGFGFVGCASPPEAAPPQLQDLAQAVFANADDPDSPELAEDLVALRELVEATDFDLDVRDRAVLLDTLNGDSLGDLSIPDGAKASNQVPRGLALISGTPLQDNIELGLEPNRVCLESDTTKHAIRTFTEGEECYPADCSTLRYEQPTRKENALAKLWYDQTGFYHVITVEPVLEEGETEAPFEPFDVLLHRYWIEERGFSDGGGNSWDQLFGLELTMEGSDGQVYVWKSLWSSITIPVIGDDSYGNLVVDAFEQSATFTDEWINGETDLSCEEDRDAEAPPR